MMVNIYFLLLNYSMHVHFSVRGLTITIVSFELTFILISRIFSALAVDHDTHYCSYIVNLYSKSVVSIIIVAHVCIC